MSIDNIKNNKIIVKMIEKIYKTKYRNKIKKLNIKSINCIL